MFEKCGLGQYTDMKLFQYGQYGGQAYVWSNLGHRGLNY